MVPKASGLAGRMATCIQRISPRRSSTTLTKSKSPMLTPAAGDEGIAGGHPGQEGVVDGLLVVGDVPEVHPDGAGLVHQGQQRRPVRVADLAGLERHRSLDQLVAGGQDPHPGPGHDPHLLDAEGGQHADVPGGEHVAGRIDQVTRHQVVARRAHRLPGGAPRPAGRPGASPAGSTGRLSSTMTTASTPAGMGAPVMMRTAWPGPGSRSGAAPARMVPMTSRRTGEAAVAPRVSAARTP